MLDCDAKDVQREDIAELVALYADTCALPCETILFLEVSWLMLGAVAVFVQTVDVCLFFMDEAHCSRR